MRIRNFCCTSIALLCVAAIASCAAPKEYVFENTLSKPYSSEQDFDIAWQKIIKFFATNQIQIQTLEKASGIISSSMLSISPSQAELWCDCGKMGLARASNHKLSFNVLLEMEPASSVILISVNTTFLTTWNAGLSYANVSECNSTGVFEKALLKAVN